ncbi:hypothetical protein OB13_10995 [Pontibacter sp. HJ8]
MSKPSRLQAVLACKCPRCRQGEVFTHPAYHLAKFDDMHEQCPVCGMYYEVEVGFFWGAMYISYGFSVGIVLAVGVLLYYLAHDPPIWVYLTTVATIVFLFTPQLFRYARIMLLHYFSGVNFDPTYPRR